MSGNSSVSPKPPSAAAAASGRSGAAVPTSQASLGVNLNELDALLDELNSSQYIKDMSRSNSGMTMSSCLFILSGHRISVSFQIYYELQPRHD